MAVRPKEISLGEQLYPDEERRRFQRLLVTLPVEYTAVDAASGETFSGEGVTRDFSLGGIYFFTHNPTPPPPGVIVQLTISTPLPPLHHLDSSQIQVRARVLRVEEPTEQRPLYGLAVAFLDFPTFRIQPSFPENSSS